MQITISSLTFKITENNNTFSITRIKNKGVKKYKMFFDSIEKAIEYCNRMAYLSDLYKEVKALAKHFNQSICAWMYKSAKRMVKQAKEIIPFNSKLRYTTD